MKYRRRMLWFVVPRFFTEFQWWYYNPEDRRKRVLQSAAQVGVWGEWW